MSILKKFCFSHIWSESWPIHADVLRRLLGKALGFRLLKCISWKTFNLDNYGGILFTNPDNYNNPRLGLSRSGQSSLWRHTILLRCAHFCVAVQFLCNPKQNLWSNAFVEADNFHFGQHQPGTRETKVWGMQKKGVASCFITILSSFFPKEKLFLEEAPLVTE